MIPEQPRAVALIPHALYWASTFYPLFVAAQLWVRVLPAHLQEWLWGGRCALSDWILTSSWRAFAAAWGLAARCGGNGFWPLLP